MPVQALYICGPLTELVSDPFYILQAIREVINFLPWLLFGKRILTFWTAQEAKEFYATLADDIANFPDVSPWRPFVPHEHYDPILHANFTPQQVYRGESAQVCNNTSLLVVVAVAPSWGGGIEVGWAIHSGIPVLILWRNGTKLSRLFQGVPVVSGVIRYDSKREARKETIRWLIWEFPKHRRPFNFIVLKKLPV